jgi:K(+)-stimulated pyrophosphate-energized sodium pump
VLALVLDHITAYFTATTYAPTKHLGQSSRESAGQSVLSGLALGFEASVWAVVVVALALLSSVWIYAGEPDATRLSAVLYGVALTGLGMLTLAGNTIAVHVFGVVAEQAQRIGHLAGLDKNARNVTNDFVVIGNITRTVTRGSAAALAVLAAVALFGALLEVVTEAQAQAGIPQRL